MTEEQRAREVIQADRDRACEYMRGSFSNKVLANEVKGGLHDSNFLVQLLAQHRQAFADEARLAEQERAAQACEQQARDFLSPEYATHQPLSSVQERFACAQCASAIRNLS